MKSQKLTLGPLDSAVIFRSTGDVEAYTPGPENATGRATAIWVMRCALLSRRPDLVAILDSEGGELAQSSSGVLQ